PARPKKHALSRAAAGRDRGFSIEDGTSACRTAHDIGLWLYPSRHLDNSNGDVARFDGGPSLHDTRALRHPIDPPALEDRCRCVDELVRGIDGAIDDRAR